MDIRFARSASRHGVSQARALYVIANCPWPRYGELAREDANGVMYLWADEHGVPLEVGAIELDGGDLLVVHAMKMRRIYQADYQRMLEWQK